MYRGRPRGDQTNKRTPLDPLQIAIAALAAHPELGTDFKSILVWLAGLLFVCIL